MEQFRPPSSIVEHHHSGPIRGIAIGLPIGIAMWLAIAWLVL